MIYAYDLDIQMPVRDLYDTSVMQMALSAAKDMYDKGEQRIKDFNKQYGDFYSPIAKDMEWYALNVTGKMQNALAEMYALGIDPLRSAEGRARIALLTNSIDVGKVNMMKVNAAAYERRLEQIAKLGDKYNPNMDLTLYGNPADFATVDSENRLHSFSDEYAMPSAYYDIDQLLEPVVKNVKPTYDEEKTKADTEHRIWTTISEKRLMDQFNDSMQDILNTPSGKYLLMQSQAEADAINAANPDANMTALDVFKQKAANRLKDHVQESFTVDPVWMKDYEHKLKKSEIAYGHSWDPKPEEPPRQLSERIQTRIGQNYFGSVPSFALSYAKTYSDILKSSGNLKGALKWSNVAKDIQSGKVGVSELKQYGLLDDNGNPTPKLFNHIMKRRPQDYWEARSYMPGSNYERALFTNLFAGTSRTAKVLDANHNEISLGDNGVHYAGRRYDLLAGNNNSGVEKEFDAWLQQNNIHGYVENKPTILANIAQANGTNLTELKNNALISYTDFRDFATQYAKNHKNVPSKTAVEDIAKMLGLTKHVDRSFTNEADGTYYSIPIIRSTNLTWDDINQQYNKSTYGSTAAGTERRAAENAGYRFLLEN